MLFITTAGASFAQPAKPETTASKTIHLSGSAAVLFVEGDVSVVLTDSKTTDLVVEGDAREIKALRVNMEEGRLSLSSAASLAQLKVYVPSAGLTRINLLGKSILRSASVLQNPNLKIVLDGEGIVNLSSTGKLVIESTDAFDFVRSR